MVLSNQQDEVAKLRAEVEALKQQQKVQSTFTLKVSEKGAVSLYGLQRFPVTFYADQWEKLLAMAEQIKSFIASNRAALASRNK